MEGIRALGSNLWKAISDTATNLVSNKNEKGQPVIMDVAADLLTASDKLLSATGAPTLPDADKALALSGLEDLVALMTSESNEAKLKAAEGLVKKFAPGIAAAAAKEVAKHASDNFVADVAQGIGKWVTENPSAALQLAANIVRVVGTAVATGGTSLAVDLPTLIPEVLSAASGVLQAAGVTPSALASRIASDFLKFMGVPEADAEKVGKIVGTLSVLGADIALAVATKGQHPINPQLVSEAVKEISLALGVPADAAAVVATGAAMAFTLGQNFAGFVLSGQPPETFGGLDKIAKNVDEVAKDAVNLFMGQEGASADAILKKLQDLGPLFQAFANSISENASTADPKARVQTWQAVNKGLVDLFPGLDPVLKGLAQYAEA